MQVHPRILLGHYGDGLRLHQLRHSSDTHLGDANVFANVIMAKTGHKSLRSVQRYVKPGLAAVPRRRRPCPAPSTRLTCCDALPCTWSFVREYRAYPHASNTDGDTAAVIDKHYSRLLLDWPEQSGRFT